MLPVSKTISLPAVSAAPPQTHYWLRRISDAPHTPTSQHIPGASRQKSCPEDSVSDPKKLLCSLFSSETERKSIKDTEGPLTQLIMQRGQIKTGKTNNRLCQSPFSPSLSLSPCLWKRISCSMVCDILHFTNMVSLNMTIKCPFFSLDKRFTHSLSGENNMWANSVLKKSL